LPFTSKLLNYPSSFPPRVGEGQGGGWTGIALLVEDIRQFQKKGAVRQAKPHDLKVVRKMGGG